MVVNELREGEFAADVTVQHKEWFVVLFQDVFRQS